MRSLSAVVVSLLCIASIKQVEGQQPEGAYYVAKRYSGIDLVLLFSFRGSVADMWISGSESVGFLPPSPGVSLDHPDFSGAVLGSAWTMGAGNMVNGLSSAWRSFQRDVICGSSKCSALSELDRIEFDPRADLLRVYLSNPSQVIDVPALKGPEGQYQGSINMRDLTGVQLDLELDFSPSASTFDARVNGGDIIRGVPYTYSMKDQGRISGYAGGWRGSTSGGEGDGRSYIRYETHDEFQRRLRTVSANFVTADSLYLSYSRKENTIFTEVTVKFYQLGSRNGVLKPVGSRVLLV